MTDSTTNPKGKGMFALPTAVYDALKDTALIYLPAAATAYIGLAGLWHFGYVTEVTGTAVVIEIFMGTVLKVSKTSYDNSDKSNDGTLIVDQSGLKDKFLFDVTKDLGDVADAKTITLKVNNITPNLSAAVPIQGMDPRLLETGPESSSQ